MTKRALAAIVRARLRAEWRAIVYACTAAAVVGFVQPRGIAGPLFFCSLVGITIALIQAAGRHSYLDLCERSAPLFGRELARAKALAPCIATGLATAVYSTTQFAGGNQQAPTTFVVALAAAIACTLTALSATIRTGSLRLFYVLLAGAVSAIAYAIAVFGASIPGELAFCALAAFLALRQYGEALARHDPV